MAKNLLPIVYVVSVAIGVLLIIASAIFLNELRPFLDECGKVSDIPGDYDYLVDEICNPTRGNVASTCLGIGAAVVQIIVGGILLNRRGQSTKRQGVGAHIAGLILSLIGFSVSMYYDNSLFMDVMKRLNNNESKIIFFYVAIGINWFFCIVAIIAIKMSPDAPIPQPTTVYVQQPMAYPVVTIPNNNQGAYQSHQQFYGPPQPQQYGAPQVYTVNQNQQQAAYPTQNYQRPQ